MKAHGWAVLEKGEIHVKTVSPTARAAIANWLMSERGQLITNCTTDDMISRIWAAEQKGARCVRITIILTASQGLHDPASTFGA